MIWTPPQSEYTEKNENKKCFFQCVNTMKRKVNPALTWSFVVVDVVFFFCFPYCVFFVHSFQSVLVGCLCLYLCLSRIADIGWYIFPKLLTYRCAGFYSKLKSRTKTTNISTCMACNANTRAHMWMYLLLLYTNTETIQAINPASSFGLSLSWCFSLSLFHHYIFLFLVPLQL